MARRRLIEAINDALVEEMERDPKVVVYGEDVELSILGDVRGLHARFGSERVRNTPRIEREGEAGGKEGRPVGAAARNPATGETIPIWLADYVLPEYGSGAIMGVPAHDQRDLDFARAQGLAVRLVYVPEGAAVRLVAVLTYDTGNTLAVGRSEPVSGSYPALTLRSAQAHLFEREVWEQHGIVPSGHPWLKPVRRDHGKGPAVGEFFAVTGREIHEVAVGPVHAGIIEPGHFRFQCNGEEVLHLEIALGYQHRGVEEALVGGPHRATLSQMETVAGDSTIAHATARRFDSQVIRAHAERFSRERFGDEIAAIVSGAASQGATA